MATYNGAPYLEKQIESINRQTFQDWELWVSDDGSSDNTLEILNSFVSDKVRISMGPRKGFVQNFLSLTTRCDKDYEYYAFSDQDDIWFPNKLERAVECLSDIPPNIPALYCSRTEIVNNKGIQFTPPLYSKLMSIPPTFRHALVQAIAGGNTFVFNHRARCLLEEFGGAVPVASHDWWLYMLVTGVGGVVYYDSRPSLFYRQHEQNISGANSGFIASYSRFKRFIGGEYRDYISMNLKYLGKYREALTKENLEIYDNFVKSRYGGVLTRLYHLRRSGVYRQGAFQSMALYCGSVLRRV